MNGQRGHPVRVTVAVAIAAALVVVALLASSALDSPRTVTTTSTLTNTLINTLITTTPVTITGAAPSNHTVTVTVYTTVNQPSDVATQTTVYCTISGEGGPTYIQVVTDQGVPIQGQQIHVIQRGPTVNGQYCGTTALPTLTTNSTGWARVMGSQTIPYAGSLLLSLVYSGQTYNATIAIYPVTWTYVAFHVPSGLVVATNCPLNNCPTSTDTSMTMGG